MHTLGTDDALVDGDHVAVAELQTTSTSKAKQTLFVKVAIVLCVNHHVGAIERALAAFAGAVDLHVVLLAHQQPTMRIQRRPAHQATDMAREAGRVPVLVVAKRQHWLVDCLVAL